MSNCLASRLLPVAAMAAALCCAPPAGAAILTEIRLGPPGTADAYVELTLEPGDGAFDLVVSDATSSRNNQIKAVITVTPIAGKTNVVLHEGDWPVTLPYDAQDMAVTSTDPQGALWLGGPAPGQSSTFGVSRHLIVFTGITGLRPGDKVSSPARTAVADIVTYRTGWLSTVADLGETIFSVASGDALWRHYDESRNATNDFTTGPVDAQGVFPADHPAALDPGKINEPYLMPSGHLPEPASLALLLAGSLFTLGRPVRRRSARAAVAPAT